MDVLDRIAELRKDRGWSEYQLAERSGVPQSTISSWYKKQMTPSFSSLEKVCEAFGITLARFFDNGDPISLTPPQRELLGKWDKLSDPQKTAFLALMDSVVS